VLYFVGNEINTPDALSRDEAFGMGWVGSWMSHLAGLDRRNYSDQNKLATHVLILQVMFFCKDFQPHFIAEKCEE
jgi:hypothetical protein